MTVPIVQQKRSATSAEDANVVENNTKMLATRAFSVNFCLLNPDFTPSNDVGSTVTLGGIVMNLCCYRVSGKQGPQSSFSQVTLLLCSRWTMTSIQSIAYTTTQLCRAVRAHTDEKYTQRVDHGTYEVLRGPIKQYHPSMCSMMMITLANNRSFP